MCRGWGALCGMYHIDNNWDEVPGPLINSGLTSATTEQHASCGWVGHPLIASCGVCSRDIPGMYTAFICPNCYNLFEPNTYPLKTCSNCDGQNKRQDTCIHGYRGPYMHCRHRIRPATRLTVNILRTFRRFVVKEYKPLIKCDICL